MPDALLVTNRAGRVFFANGQAAKLFGLTREQLMDETVERLVPPRVRDACRRERENFFANPRVRSMGGGREFFVLRADGAEIPVEIGLSPLHTESEVLIVSTIRDTSDRRMAEAKERWEAAMIALANERLRLALESSRTAGWESDIKSGRDYRFGDLRSVFGIDDDADAGYLEDFERRVHPEDLYAVRRAVADARDNRKPYTAEYRVVWPDGTVRWVRAIGKFHYSANGAAERMLGMATDITDRKHAEEAVRKSEEQYRRIVETTNEGITVLDSNFRVSFVNKRMAEMTGYRPEELLGRDVLSLQFPENLEQKKQALQRRRNGVHEQSEERLRRKDGSELWVQITANPIFKQNGQFDGSLAMISDISERKQADQALRESERELLEAQRLAQVGSWQWDPETDNISWSEESYRIANRDTALPPIKFEEQRQLYAPQSWERLQSAVQEALRSGTPYELDLELVQPDGATKWIRTRGEVLRDSTGNVIRLRGTTQDITERKRAEQALRESEERLRFAAQAGRMFAYEWNAVTDAIVRSQDCAEILGLTGDVTHATGKELLAAVHPDDHLPFQAMVASLTPQNPTFRTAVRLIRPDGRVAWLERAGRGFFDAQGKLLRVIGMAMDITERKRAEEVLRESEEKFRSVFRNAGVGMIVVSLAGRFVAANATFCDYLGYTEQELLQKTVQSITLAEDWAAFSSKLNQALSTGASFQGVEKRCLHKGGRVVFTQSSISLILGPRGEPRYFVGEVLDITKRKQAEEALSTVNQRLIEAQEQERARIARELHDDINQRLALLAMQIEQIMQSDLNLPGDLRERLAAISGQTDEIVADTQAISHQLHSSKLEHLGIVAAARSFCEEFSSQQKVEVRFSQDGALPAAPPEVSLCLFRILQEALHNAVKHSGVRHFEVRLHGRADAIGLEVSDKGVGFDPDAAANQQGLGLVSMRERVRLVQGTLLVTSKPRCGTTIDAIVPIAREEKPIGAASWQPVGDRLDSPVRSR